MPLLGAAWELVRPGPLTLERAWRATKKAFAPPDPLSVKLKKLNADVRDGAGLLNDLLPELEPEPGATHATTSSTTTTTTTRNTDK